LRIFGEGIELKNFFKNMSNCQLVLLPPIHHQKKTLLHLVAKADRIFLT